MALSFRRRSLNRILLVAAFAVIVRFAVVFSKPSKVEDPSEITEHNVLDIVRLDKGLDVHRHKFLQARIGRDETDDLFTGTVRDGLMDFWTRFQRPYVTGSDTSQTDTQLVLSSIEQLLSLNGWVAALCPTLSRPFGQNMLDADDSYDDLVRSHELYYIAIVIHSADHFLVDQLAVIVQMAKRLGTQQLFVSMLDYASSDATETLTDLCEAVLTLLGVPFRIRRVGSMTEEPKAAYYPQEEAHMRNLALEPLRELYLKRKVKFHRVIWLKGFTCPNDILETLKVSVANDAAMVCGMDWAEHNGFYIFSDRWRTRDINGDQFRQSKSSSKPDAGPPRDAAGSARYSKHLPFQVFCCESGTHVVDPAQTYYEGIVYRHGPDFHNATLALEQAAVGESIEVPNRSPDAACLDSAQAWFCRDVWVHAAREGMRDTDAEIAAARKKQEQQRAKETPKPRVKRQVEEEAAPPAQAADAKAEAEPPKAQQQPPAPVAQPHHPDLDEIHEDVEDLRNDRMQNAEANVGSDFDAMSEQDIVEEEGADAEAYRGKLSIPNNVFRPARILVNPRCVTTYAGVSHTQLALDLFGPVDRVEDGPGGGNTKYILDDWEGAPASFICQEQRQTGGRKATKTQRRLGFSIHEELERLVE